MPIVVGVDPGSDCLGVGVVCGSHMNTPPQLLELRVHRPGAGSTPEAKANARRAVHGELRSVGQRYHPDRWVIEDQPPKLRQDQHGSHVSGAGPAIWRGITLSVAWHAGQPAHEVGFEWRSTMEALHLAWAGKALKATVRLAGVGSRVVRMVPGESAMVVTLERSCGHSHPLLRSLIGSGQPVPNCPECHRALAAPKSIDKRDEWKMMACLFVSIHWPEPYRSLVEESRLRARKKGAPDHELVGVADACEAVGVAVHGLLVELGIQQHPPQPKPKKHRAAKSGRRGKV